MAKPPSGSHSESASQPKRSLPDVDWQPEPEILTLMTTAGFTPADFIDPESEDGKLFLP